VLLLLSLFMKVLKEANAFKPYLHVFAPLPEVMGDFIIPFFFCKGFEGMASTFDVDAAVALFHPFVEQCGFLQVNLSYRKVAGW
jgi:hypothetical protein